MCNAWNVTMDSVSRITHHASRIMHHGLPMPPSTPNHPDQPPRWAFVLVVGVACVVYVNTLENGLVFDDSRLVVKNADIRSLANLGAILSHDVGGLPKGHSDHTGSYRPLTTITYALNYAAHGMAPRGYHFVNILLHAACCLLAFLVCLRLLDAWRWAMGAALLFATHPVHTEAVANVTGRSELLAAGFFLTAILLYLAYRDRPRKGLICGILASYAAAMLAKESAVTLPGVIVAIDGLILWRKHSAREGGPRAQGSAVLPVYVGLVLVAALYLAARYLAVGALTRVPFTEVENPMFFASLVPRWLTRLYLLVVYARLLLWPVALSADYSFNQIPLLETFGDPRNILTLILFISLSLLTSWAFLRARTLGFGLLFTVITFSVASNLVVPIGTVVGERLLYLPSFGFCLAAAWGAGRACQTLRGRRAVQGVRALFLALLLFCGIRTACRNPDWRTNMTLMRSAFRVSPNSVKVNHNLGYLYHLKGAHAEAERYYRRALEIRPHHVQALVGLSGLLSEMARIEELIELHQQASLLEELDARIPYNCALAYQNSGDFGRAIPYLREALKIDPDHQEALVNLGYCLDEQGDTAGAMEAYGDAVRKDPNSRRAHYNRLLLCLKHDDLDNAQKFLEEAPPSLRRSRDFLSARYNLAVKILNQRKDYGRAAKHFDFILRQDPRFPGADQMRADLARWRAQGL